MDLESLFKWLIQPNVITHTYDCALNDRKRTRHVCSCKRREVVETIEKMVANATV